MGRPKKQYTKQLEQVFEMAQGECLNFKVERPWGLATKIYRALHEWHILDRHVSVKINAGEVVVKREPHVRFIDEDDFEYGDKVVKKGDLKEAIEEEREEINRRMEGIRKYYLKEEKEKASLKENCPHCGSKWVDEDKGSGEGEKRRGKD